MVCKNNIFVSHIKIIQEHCFYMSEKKTGKISDIKETASSAIEIMRQLGTPGVQESLGRALEITRTSKEIMETLKTPEFVKNIENLRVISDNMKEASTTIEKSVKELKETGIIDEFKGLINSGKNMISSFDNGGNGGLNSQTLWEMSTSLKEMFQSVRGLVDELRMTVVYSKDSGSIANIKEVMKQNIGF